MNSDEILDEISNILKTEETEQYAQNGFDNAKEPLSLLGFWFLFRNCKLFKKCLEI